MPWIFRELRDRFGVAGSLRSLFRIHVWIVVGLVVAAAIRPAPEVNVRTSFYNRQILDPLVLEIGGDINDPRAFHPREASDEEFRIAWIGGSSLQARNQDATIRRFIPQLVRQQIPEVDDRTVIVDVYLLQAMRIWDEYISVLEAIDDGADLLVVTLNPLWLFNDAAISSWPNLGPAATRDSWDAPSSWPLVASMVTPSDVLTGVLGSSFAIVDDRWSYARQLRDWVNDRTPLDRSQPPAAPEDLTELQRIAAMELPISFWSEHRNPRDPALSGHEIEADNLRRDNPDGPTWNQQIVGWMGEAIVSSGIPSVVYLAPIRSESLADPGVDAALDAIEERLAGYAERFGGENVSFEPESLSRGLPPLEFRDMIHMWLDSATPVSELLADRVCAQLEAQGHRPTCQPLPKEFTS